MSIDIWFGMLIGIIFMLVLIWISNINSGE